MPAPKEKPKGRAPKEKRGGFTPKEAGRIVREKYRRMAEQRQPEENEREYAADHLQEGLERGGAVASDLADRGRDALRAKRRADAGQRPEAPQPERPPDPPQDTPAPAPQEQGRAPRERPASAPQSGGTLPKERSPATPEMRPNSGRISVPDHRAAPKERQRHPVNRGQEPMERTRPDTHYQPLQSTARQGEHTGNRANPIQDAPPRPTKQDLKKELAKERAHAHGKLELDTAPPAKVGEPVPAPRNPERKNTPAAKTARANDSYEWTAPPRQNRRAAQNPKAGRPVPVKGRAPKKEAVNRRPIQAMRQQLKRRAARGVVQTGTRQATTQAAKKSANVAANLALKVGRAAVRAVAALFGALAGLLGGGTLLVILLVIAMAGAVIASPFGILFSNQDHTPGVIPVSLAVGQINQAFSSYLDGLQSGGEYDSVELHGAKADWVEVLAVFAVKTSLYDGEDAADVVTLDQNRVDRLSIVFWDMNPVRTWVEEIYHPPADEEDSGWTEYILHIYIEGKTAEYMKSSYGFTPAQAEALDELLAERALLTWLLSDLSISDETAREILEKLPEELNTARRAAVEKALELVGKVNYFWGGKSYVIGWDERWGQLTEVTSPGSSTTGSYLPFGLDCTGLLDWTFRNAGLQSDGHWYLETNLAEITWAEALPGDIVLYPDDSHVGLVVGRDAGGRVLVVHCSYSLNNVAISDAQTFGFTKIGRPGIYGETLKAAPTGAA